MLYSKDITVPANTAETAKQTTDLKIADGVIHKVSILFPTGCVCLVKIQMFEGGHQFISSTEGQYLSGDGEAVDIPEFYEIKGGPRYITIKTWNLDDTYDHTLQIRIYVLPKEYLLPAGQAETFIQMLRHIFVDKFELKKIEI